MNIKRTVIDYAIRKIPFVNKIVQRRRWLRRIKRVIECPDNAKIPRVEGAGMIKGDWQVMHNGLNVSVDGYYGGGMTELLSQNRGCHEPQEELVFAHVLDLLPADSTMIECGAYWSFYSMWFLRACPSGKAYMIEPELRNLKVGERNFERNGLAGHFERAGLGETDSPATEPPVTSIPGFMRRHSIERADIIHMDIQGAELSALRGALPLLEQRAFSFVFISTHSDELHDECEALLRESGYSIAVSIPISNSCSVDGVIVANLPMLDNVGIPQPSGSRP